VNNDATALKDGGGLRRMRRKALWALALVLLVVGAPALLMAGHVRAEWSLAFGHTREVTATVTGTAPQFMLSRTCSDSVEVRLDWSDVPPRSGQFTTCRDVADRSYRPGARVRVAVQPGNPEVVVSEGRGSAVFGVILEALGALAALWFAALAVSALVSLSGRRWRVAAGLPMIVLAADDPRRMRLVTSPAEPAATVHPMIVAPLPRTDSLRLDSGDLVSAVPVGRTLLLRRPRGPYVLRRDADDQVFWALGPRLLPADQDDVPAS
jgi:Protein of unknown function (DUF3592)